jgi:hypothetical protein
MAKSQKRSGREPKKPKKPEKSKLKGSSPATALPTLQLKRTAPVSDRNK